MNSPIPAASYHSDYELINAAAELAGYKDPHEILSQQTITFLGRLLEVVRHDAEVVRLARVVALFFDLPIAHLAQPISHSPQLIAQLPAEPGEMTEPCV